MAGSASHTSGTRYQALPRRLASAVLLGAIAVLAVWQGGWAFTILVTVILILGLWEFLRMGAAAGYPVLRAAGLGAGAALLATQVFDLGDYRGLLLTGIGILAVMQSFRPPLEKRLWGLAFTVAGVVYVMGLGIHALLLRDLSEGPQVLMIVLLGTWAADTMAFFVGIRFGKTPLAPQISPKKTVEGFIGGILGASIVTAVSVRFLVPELDLVAGILLGLAIGLLSPVGDLLESMIKRNLGTKDTSRLIPGHGGVLDRIDSLLVTAPASYYLFQFLMD